MESASLKVHDDIRLACGNALHEAVLMNDVDRVVRLVREYPDLLNGQTKNGSTPLHLAVLNSSRKIVYHLIASGADVGLKRISGYTPLHEAAWAGRESAVQALLRAGASPSDKDSGGYTPLELARRYRRLGCATLMARKAADDRSLAREAVEEHAASGWRDILRKKKEDGTQRFSSLHRLAEEQGALWEARAKGEDAAGRPGDGPAAGDGAAAKSGCGGGASAASGENMPPLGLDSCDGAPTGAAESSGASTTPDS